MKLEGNEVKTTTTLTTVVPTIGAAINHLEADLLSILDLHTAMLGTEKRLLARTIQRELTSRGYGFIVPTTVIAEGDV